MSIEIGPWGVGEGAGDGAGDGGDGLGAFGAKLDLQNVSCQWFHVNTAKNHKRMILLAIAWYVCMYRIVSANNLYQRYEFDHIILNVIPSEPNLPCPSGWVTSRRARLMP